MKLNHLLRSTLVLALASTVLVRAENAPTLPTALKGVALGEIPAQAATLIATAAPEQRSAKASEVVSGAVKTYPAIASAIVGAVCTKCPDLSATVAQAAAKIQPKQAQLIVQAAVAAAPKYKAEISKAMVALSESSPALKASLAGAITSLQSPQVTTASSATAAPTLPETAPGIGRTRGPIVSGPYIPLSGTPTNAPPGTPVPPSGDYARP